MSFTPTIHHREREVALVVPNALGNWSLLLPSGARAIGNYPNPERPCQIALINGYAPEIQEVRHG